MFFLFIAHRFLLAERDALSTSSTVDMKPAMDLDVPLPLRQSRDTVEQIERK